MKLYSLDRNKYLCLYVYSIINKINQLIRTNNRKKETGVSK